LLTGDFSVNDFAYWRLPLRELLPREEPREELEEVRLSLRVSPRREGGSTVDFCVEEPREEPPLTEFPPV